VFFFDSFSKFHHLYQIGVQIKLFAGINTISKKTAKPVTFFPENRFVKIEEVQSIIIM